MCPAVKLNMYRLSASSSAARIPPLQTGEHPCRHQCDLVVAYPSAVGDMSCMISPASDANIPNGDGQDASTIRRQPGTYGTNVCRPDARRRGIAFPTVMCKVLMSDVNFSLDAVVIQSPMSGEYNDHVVIEFPARSYE